MHCKVAIVVLHYESLDDTKECLDSLLQYLNGDTVQLILVDNGSKQGMLEAIVEKYSEYKQVTFLRSEENLGFAKGNNLGYKYAKRTFNPEVIVLANNDLIFEQDDFIERLTEALSKEQFDVAGPQIWSLEDGKNQNPVGLVYHNHREVSNRILRFTVSLWLSYLNLDIVVKSILGKPIEEYEIQPGQDFQLHGSCIFFANKYLEKYDGLFEGTFMYGEEFILKHIVRTENMKMCYLDTLKVWHKEGASTKKMWGKGRKQRQFFYKWSIRSLRILRDMMIEGN